MKNGSNLIKKTKYDNTKKGMLTKTGLGIQYFNRGNKFYLQQLFLEAHDEFPNYFIQSKTNT